MDFYCEEKKIYWVDLSGIDGINIWFILKSSNFSWTGDPMSFKLITEECEVLFSGLFSLILLIGIIFWFIVFCDENDYLDYLS